MRKVIELSVSLLVQLAQTQPEVYIRDWFANVRLFSEEYLAY